MDSRELSMERRQDGGREDGFAHKGERRTWPCTVYGVRDFSVWGPRLKAGKRVIGGESWDMSAL